MNKNLRETIMSEILRTATAVADTEGEVNKQEVIKNGYMDFLTNWGDQVDVEFEEYYDMVRKTFDVICVLERNYTK